MRAMTLADSLYRDVTAAETTPRDDDVHLASAVEWLYRSQDATDCGGCAATYNLVLGWEPAYPETTGYIVPTLYDYADDADAPEARERAERMARWLLDVQLDSGAFPAGTVGGAVEPSVFNTGQILFGLERAYDETGDEAFVTALRSASRWLADVQEPEGYWTDHTYKGAVHAYTSRVGWALALAADVTGDDAVERAARANMAWARSVQRDNGSFRHSGFTPDEDPVLHTIAYTIRGLVEGGAVLGDDAAVESGRHAADRLRECQRVEGGLAGAYGDEWNGAPFTCLTGSAQTAVVWYRLAELTGENGYADAARTTLGALKRTQRLDGPPPVSGGLPGSRPVWGRYMRLRYPNWAPKFFADALIAASRRSSDRARKTCDAMQETSQ